MTASAIDLQRAIFKALSEDAALVAALGGPRIYDPAPANVAFPYITFGRTSTYDWSTGTEIGSEHLLTLHFWSKAQGKAEAAELMELARQALGDGELAMERQRLVNLRLEFSEIRFDEDLTLYHGLLRFRAVMEEVG